MQGGSCLLSGWGPAFTAPAHRNMQAFPPPLQAHYSVEAGQSQEVWEWGMPSLFLSPRGKGPLVPALFLTPFLPIWHLQGETEQLRRNGV